MSLSLLSLLLSPSFFGTPAHAEDGEGAEPAEVYVGGGVALRPAWSPADGFTFGGEAEADGLLEAGIFTVRLDLDFTFSAFPAPLTIQHALPDVPVIDTLRPEWAMVQAGGDTWVARGGIVNSAYGLEDWDDWALYLPTHGQYYAVSPGRMAGGEVGYTFGNGLALSVGGGQDLDFEAPVASATVNFEADSWGTYSGIAAYPTIGLYSAVIGAEAYPAEQLTLALGGMAGVSEASPFALGSLYVVALPEAMVSPTARIEGSFDPDRAMGTAPWAASVGGAIKPTSFLKILLEGKLTGADSGVEPGVYASVCVFRPAEEAEGEEE
jgi:hypothetical protein